MKKASLKPIYKYLTLVFWDVIFGIFTCIIAILFSGVSYSEYFSYAGVFFVFGVPLYLVLRGVISRIVLKRALLPNILLFVEVWLMFLMEANFDPDEYFTLSQLILSLVITLLSFIPSLITAGIIWFIRLCKKQKRKRDKSILDS